MKPSGWVGLACFFTSGVLILWWARGPRSGDWLVTASALYAPAALYGFAHGVVLGPWCATAVGWGTFSAAALLSLPVVLTTYGFALAGTPLVVAFAVLTAAGAGWGGKIRERLLSA